MFLKAVKMANELNLVADNFTLSEIMYLLDPDLNVILTPRGMIHPQIQALRIEAVRDKKVKPAGFNLKLIEKVNFNNKEKKLLKFLKSLKFPRIVAYVLYKKLNGLADYYIGAMAGVLNMDLLDLNEELEKIEQQLDQFYGRGNNEKDQNQELQTT